MARDTISSDLEKGVVLSPSSISQSTPVAQSEVSTITGAIPAKCNNSLVQHRFPKVSKTSADRHQFGQIFGLSTSCSPR